MFKDSIGKRSNKVKNIVERGAVKKFAEAIGDTHPLYLDEETGKHSRYKQNIAPPTFPRVFDYGIIEGLNLPNKGLIHGEQIYHYERPLLVGEEIYCYAEVKDYYEKAGKNGSMGFLVLENNGEDINGKAIFTSTSIVIITEAVRKVLTV
ncbi:MaoC family dehydratase [Peribacillus cavernae]|uniref:MaoC family dehydratase n=1 Tax=Peribacillus cavernae TaxID=1674310 RepID=A0A3S0TZL4_9BACI|nr:MaoC family dehydratase N-terminal domain-containing protein [Peribacillus cavernae]MDQ0218847.1 acyl dehydratase [Peribacillus cavernae]RUQ31051.1 MaoC family dehydratase [Peribacillus cavernae]